MIDKERLAQKCSTWNIVLSGAQLDLLDAQSGTFQAQKYWKTLLGKPDDPKKS